MSEAYKTVYVGDTAEIVEEKITVYCKLRACGVRGGGTCLY